MTGYRSLNTKSQIHHYINSTGCNYFQNGDRKRTVCELSCCTPRSGMGGLSSYDYCKEVARELGRKTEGPEKPILSERKE